MNVLSLFSGIGGLELGLERAGMTTVGQVELDPFCRKVLAKHWPEVPRHDDVRTAAEWWQSKPRPDVDLICGGFPCQDISNAGLRAGIGGERSGLWSYMAHTVSVLRPRYVLMENVSAILVRGLDVVAGDLAAIGYDLQWDCIPASAVGAPHQRDRWWGVAYPTSHRLNAAGGLPGCHEGNAGVRGESPIVADAAGCGLEGRGFGNSDNGPQGGRWDSELSRSSSGVVAAVSNAAGGRWDERRHGGSPSPAEGGQRIFQPARGSRSAGNHSYWSTQSDVRRVADGIPARVDRLRSLGNAVVPQVAEHVGRLILEADSQRVAA